MKNFIQHNIDNIKGARKPGSLIHENSRDLSPTKPKFNYIKNRSPQRPSETINEKVRKLENELSHIRNESQIM